MILYPRIIKINFEIFSSEILELCASLSELELSLRRDLFEFHVQIPSRVKEAEMTSHFTFLSETPNFSIIFGRISVQNFAESNRQSSNNI